MFERAYDVRQQECMTISQVINLDFAEVQNYLSTEIQAEKSLSARINDYIADKGLEALTTAVVSILDLGWTISLYTNKTAQKTVVYLEKFVKQSWGREEITMMSGGANVLESIQSLVRVFDGCINSRELIESGEVEMTRTSVDVFQTTTIEYMHLKTGESALDEKVHYQLDQMLENGYVAELSREKKSAYRYSLRIRHHQLKQFCLEFNHFGAQGEGLQGTANLANCACL